MVHKSVTDQLANTLIPEQTSKIQPLSPEILEKLQVKIKALEEKDWQDAQQGVYPSSLLFDNSWSDFFRYYPEIWLDTFNSLYFIILTREIAFLTALQTLCDRAMPKAIAVGLVF